MTKWNIGLTEGWNLGLDNRMVNDLNLSHHSTVPLSHFSGGLLWS
jgi:hypothetical protein